MKEINLFGKNKTCLFFLQRLSDGKGGSSISTSLLQSKFSNPKKVRLVAFIDTIHNNFTFEVEIR